MNALDVLCAQLTRDLFPIAKFLLTIGRLLLHCWYSLGRPVTIGTPMVIFAVLTVFDDWYTVGTVLVDLWRLVHQWSFFPVLTVFWLFLTIGTPLVHCWYSLGRPVTIDTPMVLSVFDDWFSAPFVKNSQKQWRSLREGLGFTPPHSHRSRFFTAVKLPLSNDSNDY